jgi:hypothetical protein
VADTARKTFLLQNEFDHVDEPISDRGARTILRGNKRNGPGRKSRLIQRWAMRRATAICHPGNRKLGPRPRPSNCRHSSTM